MSWWTRTLVVLSVGLLGACAATTPTAVTHASKAREAAARDFSCGEKDLTIQDADMGVFLIEGCGQLATFYCAEDRTLSMRCKRIDDDNIDSIEAQGNIADAIAAQDKADEEEANAEAERPRPHTSAAKQTP